MYFKRFTDTNVPNPDVILPYRIYFQVTKSNHQNISIYDSNKFDFEIWKDITDCIVKNANGKTGKFNFNLNF